MDHDDEQVGRVLSRREALKYLGLSGGALLAAPGTTDASSLPYRLPACVVRPSQTEGPYFVETDLNRSDIRSDPTDGAVSEGVPLRLRFQVTRLGGQSCEPLAGALVDVWQCDAMGVYSGVEDFQGFFDTTGKRFLRGHQLTDREGMADFTTIYPGWYTGRAVHIHFKIRTRPDDADGHEFTSQVYFEDSLSDRIFAEQPYAAHEGERTLNSADRFYRSGGSQLMLNTVEEEGGLVAVFDVGLQID